MARLSIDVQQKPERISKMLSQDLSLVFASMVAIPSASHPVELPPEQFQKRNLISAIEMAPAAKKVPAGQRIDFDRRPSIFRSKVKNASGARPPRCGCRQNPKFAKGTLANCLEWHCWWLSC
ncbi:unnamed protein product [Cercospora beticola]|nr:unnamed protein product [Cercospora beticola]